MSNKRYLSKEDFLAGITCKPVDFEVPELGLIRVRGLTTLESESIDKARQGDGDNIRLMLETVRKGLVEPMLDESDLNALGQGRPGLINKMAERIMQLSGLVEGKAEADNLEKKVGNGS